MEIKKIGNLRNFVKYQFLEDPITVQEYFKTLKYRIFFSISNHISKQSFTPQLKR